MDKPKIVGIYLKNAEDCVVDNCSFVGGDVAIVEVEGKGNVFSSNISKDSKLAIYSESSKNTKISNHEHTANDSEGATSNSTTEKAGAFLGAAAGAFTKVMTE